ncbi:peptidoglycan-binding protein [Streptomyces sp. NPDC020571]|uniref:peptidoglycan-binding protein n=1 Tax=Streptomyces sp. NPDC020571 TaxID=3365079 RepID=UPI00378E18D6
MQVQGLPSARREPRFRSRGPGFFRVGSPRGSATRSAVVAFRRHNKIGGDGIVGPDTWWALRMP